ncbi:MAG: nitrilase family protein [Bacteroidales bacterium]|nr:nitrilase family protein [Bacteroidales bacterium]
MRVRVIQQDIIWGKPEDNFRHLDRLLESSAGNGGDAELYVLPEMFSTGFATQEGATVEYSDPEDGKIKGLEWMKSKAVQYHAAFAGSIALDPGDGKLVNRLFFVKPDGSVTHYDKKHLFQYGGEHLRFNAGEERTIVGYGGFRMLLAVCYDLRFPVWLRNRGDYDAIIVVANWPDVRRFAWDTLLRARAIENQCYVIAANRVGRDPACVYSGGSAIVGPYGEDLAVAADGEEFVVTGNMDLGHLKEFIGKFPVLADADDFDLK